MDGIASVTQRIAHIQTRIASVSPAVTPPRTPVSNQPSAASFAQALQEAVVAQQAPTAVPGAHAGLDADGVPLDLAVYGNGKIPAAALAPLQVSGAAGHRLWAPAAQAFEQLHAAAAREGITIGVTDSYRSYEAQVDVAQRKGLYSQGGLAAVPGTSDHGWGLSIDLALDGRALSWMRANAARFGFVEDVPREPWHWTFTPPPSGPTSAH